MYSQRLVSSAILILVINQYSQESLVLAFVFRTTELDGVNKTATSTQPHHHLQIVGPYTPLAVPFSLTL
jgi:hypothetical protein